MTKLSFSKTGRKRLALSLIIVFFLTFFCIVFCSCKKQPNLLDYVSEYRNNLFLYECENFSVKVQNVEKEHPYVADGYKSEMTHRAEVFITPPKGAQACAVLFIAGGIEHKGEASYDNVKQQFYYSCAADLSNTESLPMRLTIDGEEIEITLNSVKSSDLMPLNSLLSALFNEEKELLKTLTCGKEFAGELYVRLLYEDAPYFYVGVVDRSGNITAFLLDGKTGKILARRKS